MQHAMTTTAFTLDGFRIAKTLGVVRGITVRSRSIFGTIGGALQAIVGCIHIGCGFQAEARVALWQ